MRYRLPSMMLVTMFMLLVSFPAGSYEDLTHQALTKRALQISMAHDATIPGDFDPNKGLGQQVINGAGEGPERRGESPDSAVKTDGEDYTKYHLDWSDCEDPVKPKVSGTESLNHFESGKLIGHPAWITFIRFYNDAVELWNRGYKAQAAFMLGRCLHLVEDMAQPQHAMNEWHLDKPKLGGLLQPNISYLEGYVEANIRGGTDFCPGVRYDYAGSIASLDPQPPDVWADPWTAVNEMAATSTLVGNDFLSKGAFTGALLNLLFPQDPPVVVGQLCPLGGDVCSCQDITLPFQFALPVTCGSKVYRQAGALASTGFFGDYSGDPPCPSDVAHAVRLDMAMRLNERVEDSAAPGAFGAEVSTRLLSPGVGEAAAVVIAFWKDVATSNANPRPCEPPPGHESPDDSVGVKASSRTESGAVPASYDWHDVCRVGIAKGLPAMADYGVSSALMDQLAALDPNGDPAVAQALYDRLEVLEAKYSGPQNLMPQEVAQATDVAVWERGFSGSARSLVEAMQEPVTMLEEPQEPVFTDEDALSLLPPQRGLLEGDPARHKILVLPTGSLYGLRADSVEAQALQGFVQQGGIVVSFTQPYGDDFSALPVPAGQALQAAGYKQDLSCFADSAYPTMEHPILSGITRTTITAGFDGYFRTIPTNATVLLRRTISGEPCLILYPVGQGYVVASTLYEDWGYANGQSTADGRSILANILAWAKAPNQGIPVTNLSSGGSASGIAVTLHVRNLSDTSADQMEVLVMTPDRQAVAGQSSLSVSIPAHSEADVPVTLDLSSYFGQNGAQYGIFHADYRLLSQAGAPAPQEEEIQPQGETETGRFVIEAAGTGRQSFSQTVFSTWTDDDVAGNPAKTVHIHLEDHTGTARTMHLWTCYMHENGILLDTITLAPNGVLDKDVTQDLSRPGPYHYYLTDPTYGFVPYSWWAWMFGNDPWLMAAQGYAYMFGNGGPNGEQRYVSVSAIAGIGNYFEPTDTITGNVTIANPRSAAEDVTAVFALVAAGRTVTQSQAVHLEAGASQAVSFSLALPGAIAYYRTAIVSAGVYLGGSLVGGTSALAAVDAWQPNLVLAPQWVTSPTLATLATMPLTVHVVNQSGERVADSAGYELKAGVYEVTGAKPWLWPRVEEETVPIPDLHPGGAADVTVQWTQWQPTLGKTYSLQLQAVNAGQQWLAGGKISRSISVNPPWLYAGVPQSMPGESTAVLVGGIMNGSDLSWEGQLEWSCPALGLDSTQAATALPKQNIPVSLSAPRPDAVAAGDYPYTMTFTAPGLTAPLTTLGTLHVVPPEVGLTWPGAQPVFRHDEDGTLALTMSLWRAAAPLGAMLDATMAWTGGSATVASGEAVTLDPAQPAAVTLTLPTTQMPAPGPFTVQVTLHVPQGNVEKSWTASYTLKGPAYSGGFSNLTVAPGDALTGEIQNVGTFEGNAQVAWSLADAQGMIIDHDNQTWPVAVGGSASLNETLPSTVLPGSYTSTLIVTDPDAGQPTILRQNLAVTGTLPTLTLSTDRSIYGTASPVALNLHVEDPAQALDGSWAHLEVQRYLGLAGQGGGVAGPPSASWATPDLDGSGTYWVNPSEWFVDPSTGRGGYARDVSGELAPGEIPSIAADINGDGKAELIGTNGLNVSLSSQGDLGSGMLKRFAPMVHRLVKSKGTSHAGGRAEGDFQSWLTIPATTWSQPGDSWTSIFLLGLRDDGLGSGNPLCLGLADGSTQKAAVLMVRWDGTVLWRRDLAAPFVVNTVEGPVFADLNGDGPRDILFKVNDTLYALNGATGESLWTYACPQYSGPVFCVGHAAGAVRIWVASSPSSGETLTLLDASGQRIYQTVPDGGLEPSTLVTGDVDGDGNDEAVICQAWNGASPPLEVFRVDGPTPIPTSLIPQSPVDLYDINGDGKAEAIFVMTSNNPDRSRTQAAVAVDLTTGELVWSSPLPDVPADYSFNAIPILYRTREGQAKLVVGEDSEMMGVRESYQPIRTAYLIDAATGTLEQSVAGMGRFYTLVAGDFDGDGVSELYTDGILLDDGCMAPDGTSGPCEEWETVWQDDRNVLENGQTTLDLSEAPGPMAAPGTYRTVATVSTNTGQSIEAQPAGFSVVNTNLGLTLAPAADTTIRTDESLSGTVGLGNEGTATESSITVTLLVDGQAASTWQVPSLDPGAEQDFPFSLAPAPAGKHALEVQATENGTVVAALRSGYVSASPQMAVTLGAPASHTEVPFTVTATVANTGLVPVQVAVALSDDPGHPVDLTLQPQASSPVSFTRQSTEAYAAQLTVSGDVQQTLSIAVPYAYQLTLSVPDIGPQQVGTISVPVHVTQSGGSPYSGSLTAMVTQAGAASTSTWPFQVAAGGNTDVTLPLSILTPGAASLHLAASLTGATADASFVLYQGGVGTLAITLPPTLGEGAASIPFSVQNGLATQGSFDVQLLWNGGGGAQQVAEASLSVAGSGSGGGLLVPTLPAGTGTLQALLNGVVAASQSVTVLPMVQASLTLTPVQPADGPPTVSAVVANTGYGPLDATLAVRSDTASASSTHVDAGGQTTQTIAVNADGFGGTEAPVSATLYLPDGTTITRTVTLTLQPAQLTVIPPAAPVVLIPGQASSLPFTIANAGDLSAQLLFSVDFPDGEQEHFEQTAEVPGHGSTPVAVAIPLSGDVPNGSANAHYVVRRTGGAQAVLAEGDLPVTIQGPTVSVSASLDGVAYAVGATATANVAFSLTPPDAAPETVTVRVIGGSFEDERLVTVSGSQSETFAIPIAADTDGVSVEVVQPGGRSLYINRFRVYPLGGGFTIHPDKSAYQAGETVTISANLPSAGSLRLNFMSQEVTLQGSGTLSQAFTLPADTAEDSYSVAYDYTPTDTTVSPASGGMSVDVHGILVTGGESHLDKSTYANGESLSGEIVLYTNQALTGTLKFWNVEPDGSYGYAGDQAVTLAAGSTPGRFPFTLPFATTQSGTHRLAYSLVGSSGSSTVGGSLPFQVGTGVLLGVAASQYAYPQGTESASLQLRTAGSGAANVSVALDGNPAAQNGLALNGVQTSTLSLGSVSPGEHAVTATLTDSAGLVSVARCRFLYGSVLPDLTGSVSAACRTANVLPVFLVVTNGGAGPAGASTASLYDGDPQAGGGVLISAVPVPALSAGAEFTFEYDWDVTGRDGAHEIYLVADSQGAVKEWDETNNTSQASVTVQPGVAIDVTPPDNTCSAQPIVPLAQATPAGTQVTATLDGAPYTWGTSIADEGDHALTVTAPNGCGDASTTLTVHYTIDLTPPVVQISGVADGGSYTVPVQPAFQATDLHLAQTTALLNGAALVSGTTLTNPGDYTLVVTATDCAGNTGEASAHFTVSGSSTPTLPPFLSQVAWFGCDSLNVNGAVKLYGVPSVGGSPGFGGHVASNGSITVSGSNLIDGNATPGPGQSVRITGQSGQVLGSTDPASAAIPCDEQRAADWLAYATDHNDNTQIPAQYLDGNGNFKLNGNKTCTLPGGIYWVHSFTVNGNGSLVAAGGVTFVITGSVTINGSCKVNDGGAPENLVLVSASAQSVMLNGNARVNLQIFAPLAPVTVNGNLTGYGNLWGKTLLGNGGVVWNRVQSGESLSSEAAQSANLQDKQAPATSREQAMGGVLHGEGKKLPTAQGHGEER